MAKIAGTWTCPVCGLRLEAGKDFEDIERHQREHRCPDCIDGWIPGENGIERCDDCQRFADDDEAAAYVANIDRTLFANYHSDADENGSEPPDYWRRALREIEETD